MKKDCHHRDNSGSLGLLGLLLGGPLGFVAGVMLGSDTCDCEDEKESENTKK